VTLAIALVNPEGVVLAADSRQTYTRAGIVRVGSDTGVKVFELTQTVVAATSGYGFLRPAAAPLPLNISALVEDLKANLPATGVLAIATALHSHFSAIYAQHIVHSPTEAVAQGNVAVTFIVAGYDSGSRVGLVFEVNVPGPAPTAPVQSSNNPGGWMIGQRDVAMRIFRGYDDRLLTLPIMQPAQQAGTATPALQQLTYIVNWHTMTLQDSIDFITGMIQITATIQRFADGIIMQPGNVPGVGGPIDVVVIRPGGTVTWVARKALKA
jgi:hypothetical protein